MATSLAAQLQKLAVPQTTLLQRDKKRASLLFDQKEAASIDRDTIYDIGISGLRQLIVYNDDFKKFEKSLFSTTSRSIERAVESKGANVKLNEKIKNFLMLLSPYFLLQPAHKALEWLINRFSIHEYNKEDFFKLILPYHESNIFVKCLQLFNLLSSNDRWHWLRPLQKSGVHLPKLTLYNHAASDTGFLQFIGQMVTDAVQENTNNSSCLTTLFTFYCTTTIGALEHSRTVTEPQLSAILVTLAKGLDSTIPDFLASSYLITAELLKKVILTRKTLKQLMKKITLNKQLRMEATMLILILYQTQKDKGNFASIGSIENMTRNNWFITNLRKLANEGGYVMPLFMPIVTIGLKYAKKEVIRNFLESLVTEVRFDDNGAQLLIMNVLENYKILFNDKQDKFNDNVQHLKNWYASFLKQIEKQYPNAFDDFLKTNIKSNTYHAKIYKKALSSLMTIMMSTSTKNMSTFELLYHRNPEFRANGVKYLVKQIDNLTQEDRELFQVALGERIVDDDPIVIQEVFQLTTAQLIDIMGENAFEDAANKLLLRCYSQPKLLNIVMHVVRAVCYEDLAKNPIFLTSLLPYLFPLNTEQLNIAIEILYSDISTNYNMFKLARKNVIIPMKPEDFCSLIYESMVQNTCSKHIELLLDNAKNLSSQSAIHKYLSCLLIVTNLPVKSNPETCLLALNYITSYLGAGKAISCKNHKITQFITAAAEKILPLQGFLDCISIILDRVDHTKLNFSFENNQATLFMINIISVLLKGCNLKQTNTSLCYVKVLEKLLLLFPDYKTQINFLANLIVIDNYPNSKLDQKTQLRVAIILKSMLAQSKNNFDFNCLVPSILIGSTNRLTEIRQVCLDILKIISKNTKFTPLIEEILKREDEILIDTEQLSLILCSISSNSKLIQNNIKYLFNVVANSEFPFISSNLLKILTFINTDEYFKITAKLGLDILKKPEITLYESDTLYNGILRFNGDRAKTLHLNPISLEFLKNGLKTTVAYIEIEPNQFKSPSELILEQISREVFNHLNYKIQKSFMEIFAELSIESTNPDCVYAVNKTIKRIDLNAELVIAQLNMMKEFYIENSARKVKRNVIPTPGLLETKEWKIGLAVLEFIQNKKKLTNVNILFSVLFDILQKCLDFDDQGLVEYPKQIILSTILHCSKKVTQQNEIIPENAFRIDLVVRCIRASQNPQTHHHALLVLAYSAQLLPHQVLHSMMDIFTFMGSTVLRHDDAYSFQIISNIIESVVPILVTKSDEYNAVSVLRVFVDAVLDIPEHRRNPLYKKLLITFGAEDYLWQFLLLIFEAHATTPNNPNPRDSKNRLVGQSEIPKRIEIAIQITLEFPIATMLKTAIKLLDYLKQLPVEHDSNIETAPFLIKHRTPKQFRHFKYLIVKYLSSFLSSKQLLNSIAALPNSELLSFEPYYKSLLINILTFVKSVSITTDQNANTPQAQYWRVIQHQSYDILDSINALLTTEMFLLVIRGLIAHNLPTVRRKAMEIFNTKLQHQIAFFYTNPDDDEITDTEGLFALLPSIIGIIKTDINEKENEIELTKQTALLTLKLLVKTLASKYPDKFIPVLDFITDLMKSGKVQGNILASVVLCLAELVGKLRAHSIPGLVKYMPVLIKILKHQKSEESPGLLLMCVITSIQKIVETLPLFLSSYLEKLLCELSILSSRWSESDKTTPLISKLKSIRSNIGLTIPSRVLIPIISQTYETLLHKQQFLAIGPLMNILSENLANLHGHDLISLLPELTNFFLHSLSFRSEHKTYDDINSVEDNLISTLIVLVLKLSETTFRPLYYRLYDWAINSETKTTKIITFYRLSHKMANSLKGLFVLFAGHFIKNCSSILNECNQIKSEQLYFTEDENNILLIESIIKTLSAVFLHDSQNFVDKDRFDTLMQPIVDQLENDIGDLNERATNLIIPCIAQFAVASADDSLWKQLNYQVLLKTRHNLPVVRVIALNCVCEVARKVGEDFLPLLPETIPFLAELLEDEDESVEAVCRKVVQDLEQILGEPLQKYF